MNAHLPKLLIVGTYHFENSGRDLIKSELDEHLAPKRQAEIEAVIKALAKFKPTKIAVEETFENIKTNQRFESWLKGEYQLKGSEVDQIGFRLGKEMGHKKLYPIDSKLDLDFDPIFKAATPKQAAQLQKDMGSVQALMAQIPKQTVLQSLIQLNSPESDKAGNGLYLRLTAIRSGNDQVGTRLVSDWWKRNLMWLSNLTTIVESEEDRILLICGAGHASLLRSILRDSIDFEVENIQQILQPK